MALSHAEAPDSKIIVKVLPEAIDVATWMLNDGGSACGAQTLFLGKVRERNHGKNVVSVFYDAFEPLAERVFYEICTEAKTRWGEALELTVVHRVGELKPEEISVLIHVASPHRDEAYQASRYVIEQVKERAPIWKKEKYEDGETEWLKGHALCGHHA